MISQRHYTLNFLYKFGMTECKSVATPLDRNLKLDVDSDTVECEPTNYQQLVCKPIYPTIIQGVRLYVSREFWRIWTSPSTMQSYYTTTTSTIYILLKNRSSMLGLSISRCTTPLSENVSLRGMSTFNTSTTNVQTTKIFTKALEADKLWQFSTQLGLLTTNLSSLRGSD